MEPPSQCLHTQNRKLKMKVLMKKKLDGVNGIKIRASEFTCLSVEIWKGGNGCKGEFRGK
jgi:hypothetical protein